jgi:hypothetical protein
MPAFRVSALPRRAEWDIAFKSPGPLSSASWRIPAQLSQQAQRMALSA